MSGIIYEHAERLQPDAGNDVRAQTCEAISRDPAQLQEAVDACPDAKRQIVGERYLLNLGKGGVAR